MQETLVWSLGWEDPLEKSMATHSSILSWRISWTVFVCSVAELCLTLWDSTDCSPQSSSVHRLFPARILEWVAISSSRGSSPLGLNLNRLCFLHWQVDFFTTEILNYYYPICNWFSPSMQNYRHWGIWDTEESIKEDWLKIICKFFYFEQHCSP